MSGYSHAYRFQARNILRLRKYTKHFSFTPSLTVK
jgi:hypothetical protein